MLSDAVSRPPNMVSYIVLCGIFNSASMVRGRGPIGLAVQGVKVRFLVKNGPETLKLTLH